MENILRKIFVKLKACYKRDSKHLNGFYENEKITDLLILRVFAVKYLVKKLI
jgi:hypothetical protein